MSKTETFKLSLIFAYLECANVLLCRCFQSS